MQWEVWRTWISRMIDERAASMPRHACTSITWLVVVLRPSTPATPITACTAGRGAQVKGAHAQLQGNGRGAGQQTGGGPRGGRRKGEQARAGAAVGWSIAERSAGAWVSLL